MRQFLPGVFLIAALQSVFVPHVNSQDGATPGFDSGPSWSPAGNSVVFSYFSDNQYDIWVVDNEGQDLQRVTNTPDVSEVVPRFSPDGKYISFINLSLSEEERNDLWILEIATQRTVNLTEGLEGNIDSPVNSWSPDSMSIAFTMFTLLEPETARKSFIVSIDTLNIIEIDTGNDDLWVYSPVWSKDGTKIAFLTSNANTTASRPPENGLWVADVVENGELSEIEQVIFNEYFIIIKGFDENKSLIANGVGDTKLDVFKVDVENGQIDNLTQDLPFIVGWATLAPTGDRIAFSSQQPDELGVSEIRILDVDVAVSEPLIIGQGRFPEWSPDSNNIVFETATDAGREIRIYDVAEGEIETLISPTDFK